MKKKIKIIDILCYISTGNYDMLPKKIKYEEIEWNLDTNNCCNADYTDSNQYMIADYIDKHFIIQEVLNEEVIILDEEDEFEDIEIKEETIFKGLTINDSFEHLYEIQLKLWKNQKKIIERLKDEE